MLFDPMNPPKNLKPAQVEENWPKPGSSRQETKEEVPPVETASKPSKDVDELDEAAWHEDDPQVAEPAEEEPVEAETQEAPEAEEPEETEAQVEEPEEEKEFDLSTLPEEARKLFERRERALKKKDKEIRRQSRKNRELKELAGSVKSLTDFQVSQVQAQQQAQYEANQRAEYNALVQQHLNANYSEQDAVHAANIIWRARQPAQPTREQLEIAEIKQQLAQRTVEEQVGNYMRVLRSELKKATSSAKLSEDAFEDLVSNAADIAAAKQILDPSEAAARVLKPMMASLKSSSKTVRRPQGKNADVHRAIAQSGRTGSRQAGSTVSGRKPPKDAEQIEREMAATEDW